MKEITGDFWDNCDGYDLLVFPSNGVVLKSERLVMGAGVAKDFKERYKGLDFRLGKYLLMNDAYYKDDRGVYQYGCLVDRESGIAAIQTKMHWQDDSSPSLIKWGCRLLSMHCEALGFNNVLMTRPGCGLGNLVWKDVKSSVKTILDDRFTIVNKD